METQTRFYRHYKNKPYKLLGTVRHSETLDELTLYESLYENKLGRLWVRPKDMFFEDVMIDGIKRPRFEKINFKTIETNTLNSEQIMQIAELYEICFRQPINKEKFQSVLEHHNLKYFVLAFETTRLVGFKLGYAQDCDLFYSWLGCVLPEYENLGLASLLMQKQHEWAKNHHFAKIQTRTRNEFVKMIRLNLKFGFDIIGTQVAKNNSLKVILEKKLAK